MRLHRLASDAPHEGIDKSMSLHHACGGKSRQTDDSVAAHTAHQQRLARAHGNTMHEDLTEILDHIRDQVTPADRGTANGDHEVEARPLQHLGKGVPSINDDVGTLHFCPGAAKQSL